MINIALQVNCAPFAWPAGQRIILLFYITTFATLSMSFSQSFGFYLGSVLFPLLILLMNRLHQSPNHRWQI